jgi:RNA recognition motif-containing protein
MAESHSIIIRNLSYFCCETDLIDFLNSIIEEKPFSISSIKIERSETDKRSLLHGFADVSTYDGAQYVISTLNDVVFMGRKLKYVFSVSCLFFQSVLFQSGTLSGSCFS